MQELKKGKGGVTGGFWISVLHSEKDLALVREKQALMWGKMIVQVWTW